MTDKYQPWSRTEPAFDPAVCAEGLMDHFLHYQCRRPIKVTDENGVGWCGLHSPAAQAKRDARYEQRTAEQRAISEARKREDAHAAKAVAFTEAVLTKLRSNSFSCPCRNTANEPCGKLVYLIWESLNRGEPWGMQFTGCAHASDGSVWESLIAVYDERQRLLKLWEETT